MADITSNILKNIFSKKLTKAKEGIAKNLRNKSFKAIEDYKNSFRFELSPLETKKEDMNDLKRANKDKVSALKKANKEKESEVKRNEMEKEAEKNKSKEKKESLVRKVMEYIKSDGARKKCAGGDGRRTENHDCDKVHSGSTHKEWEASQDTPKDEASGGKEAYQKFFNAKLKKYGVKSPAELDDDEKKKFYNEIDKEWEGDNEED